MKELYHRFMLSAPEDLDVSLIEASLRKNWRVNVDSLTYAPVGFGAHHWTAKDASDNHWFVTIDDLDAKSWLGSNRERVFAEVRSAYLCASALSHECGLSFVLAPSRDHHGEVLHRLSDRWSICVTPFVEGTTGSFDETFSGDTANGVARLLATLHSALPPSTMPRAHLLESDREPVLNILSTLDTNWTGGPWSNDAHAWCLANLDRIHELLERHQALSHQVATRPTVVTHGEPHPGNVMVTPLDRSLLLIDWDTVALAAPERDLWLAARRHDGLVDWDFISQYEDHAHRSVDPAGLALGRITWTLADVASLADRLRRTHRRNEETDAVWGYLNGLDLLVE